MHDEWRCRAFKLYLPELPDGCRHDPAAHWSRWGQRLKKTQFQGYEEFHQAAKELLNEHGYDEKGLGIVEKARTYFMINLQTMTDPSVSHIASMLITGSSMGIVEAIQKYRQYEDADPKIRDLMDKLRKFEEYNMEKLKDFLWKSYSAKLPASADTL